MKPNSKALGIVASVLCALFLMVSAAAWADDSLPQAGLPPELVIPSNPPLADQLQQLQQCQTLAQAMPGVQKTGGPLSGVFSFFSGGGEKAALPVTVSDLISHVDTLKGQLVGVDGIYAPLSEKGTAVFHSDGGDCKIVLAGGTVPVGFPEAGPAGLPAHVEGTVEVDATGKPTVHATKLQPSMPLLQLRLARISEIQQNWDQAKKLYGDAATAGQKSNFWLAGHARFTQGRISLDKIRERKAASNELWMAWQQFTAADPAGNPRFYAWRPKADASGWEKVAMRDALREPLDSIARDNFWYKVVDFFVSVCGGNRGLGILLIALVVRTAIYPLTKKQMHSGKAMQKLQPQIKALQQEFKDDKQKFQEEFWKLCKANSVNPFGGCLPLIVQMPILIFIYQGIRSYIVKFDGHGFLWAQNLSQPDMPLLVLYTLSMILFQKMTTKMQPTMDPQQAQQQQMMTYMMPLMFFVFFKTFPAAFMLYWLGTNVIYFVQQWLYMREPKTEAVAVEGTAGKVAPLAPAAAPKSTAFSAIMSALSGKKPESGDVSGAQTKSFDAAQKADKGKKARKEPGKDTRGRKR